MFTRHTKLRSVIIAVAMLAIVGGAVLAAVVVTNSVSATVTVQVTAPDGVEIYLDEGLTQVGDLIDFGDVNADVFGTTDGDPPAVPVWIKNVSFSDIRLSLSDDFPHGDVRFQGRTTNPILLPDQTLAGVFLLEFAQGVDGTFNFAVAVEAEGPLGIPDPSGSVTIAVSSVNSPNGLPRFCSAGCSETIYLSGITETLFNSLANSDGTVTTEPMLALDFTLDPSLEFGDFTLREGVMFHREAGEMTAEDVAFSFNDANAVTSPGSIHGQAGDFSPLIQSMEAIDTHKVRLNYRNYDSRGMLHRFSMFWQSAGIVSKNVFDTVGVEGMQDLYIGTGAFVADEWTPGNGIYLTANPNYWGIEDGLGPYLDKVNWLQVPEGAVRRTMLETGEVQIAQAPTKDLTDLIAKGFEAQKGGLHNVIRDISFTGNYWEAFGALSGAALERNRDISKPWVGNPFENGDEYDENTPSMQNARKVRTAFAWAIEREALVESITDGLGFVNHQAYLSTNNPNYLQEWSWGTDFAKATQLMADAGQSDGFEMDVWVGTGELGSSYDRKWCMERMREVAYPAG
ncbi:MAG: ABC transporter substrate-binding protein [SAR202 cluster bacterium]|jgi:ABC-type transport system substrate-binding protein|nr:ABC transporter substrate-binding protein [SAR202 cluster bacterium]MDP6511864.1 ABC transporter substrate-binding protein [SAR202 cluster bacterium]